MHGSGVGVFPEAVAQHGVCSKSRARLSLTMVYRNLEREWSARREFLGTSQFFCHLERCFGVLNCRFPLSTGDGGGPFPSDTQALQDSRSLQAEFSLPCLLFVTSYFYSCNPLWQALWSWSVLSLHPQGLPSGIKPSTQKCVLNFQLPYGYMYIVCVSSWGGTYSAKGPCNSGLFAKGFLGLEALWSRQGVPEDSVSVL